MTAPALPGQALPRGERPKTRRDRQPRRKCVRRAAGRVPCFPEPARHETLDCRIRPYLRAIEVKFLAPDQSGLETPFDNLFKELLEHTQSIARANFAETAVIGHGFIQIVTQVPTMGKVNVDHLHELSLGAKAFKEHDQLQFKEDDWINGRPSY